MNGSACWLLIGVFLSALLILPGCDSKKYTAEEHIQRAKQFQSEGNIKAAIIELKNAAQKNPDHLETRLLLANLYLDSRMGKAAEKELSKAVTLGMKPELLQIPFAKSWLLQGRFQRVLDQTSTDLESSPKNKAILFRLRADAGFNLGRLDSCDGYVQSIETDPETLESYWGLARCAIIKGDLAQADKHLQTALQLNRDNARTWVMLGDLARMQNKPAEAEKAYRNAIEIQPGHIGAGMSLAALYINSNQLEKAHEELEKVRRTAPNNMMAQYLQAILEMRNGKFNEAKARAQKIIQAAPKFMPAYLIVAITDFTLGELNSAIHNGTLYKNAFPGSRYARQLLAAAYLKNGNPRQALKTIQPLMARDDPLSLSLAGEAYLLLGQSTKATEFLEKAATLLPDSADLKINLGLGLLALGKSDKAMDELAGLTLPDEIQPKLDRLTTQILLSQHKFNQALKRLEAMERRSPDNPYVYNMKAAAYMGLQEKDKAKQNLEKALAVQPDYHLAALNLAKLEIQAGELDKARDILHGVLEKNQNNVSAMIELAILAAEERKEKEFLSWVEKANKADPEAFKPQALLADYYLRHGAKGKALTVARAIVSSHPRSPEAWVLLGKAQLATGDFPSAIHSFKKLVSLAPRSPLAHFYLASAQAASDYIDDARQSFRAAIALKPDYTDALVALIGLEAQAGDLPKAIQLSKELQRQNPKDPLGLTLEGDVLMHAGKFSKALKAYEQAFAIKPDSLRAIKRHQAEIRQGKETTADDHLAHWLEDKPNETLARQYLASRYIQRGMVSLAIAEYQKLVQAAPHNALYLNDLAWLYQQAQDPRAIATAQKALELAPENPRIMDTLGWILVQNGKLQRGLDLLQQADTHQPGTPEIRYHLAAAYHQAGNPDKSREILEELLGSDEPFALRPKAKELLHALEQSP